MKTLTIVIASIMALASLTGCKKEAGAEGGFRVNGTWRYKMTVTVETPEGIKSGYAVREVSNSISKFRIDLPEAGNPADVIGEAVVVDLGPRGKLFGLLSGYKFGPDNAEQVVYKYFGGGSNADGIKLLGGMKEGKATVDLAYYPVLVMFTDINDPRTVKPILEVGYDRTLESRYFIKADRFEELFGRGVKLKEITIEMTDEPVTSGIEDDIQPFGGSAGPYDRSTFIRKRQ